MTIERQIRDLNVQHVKKMGKAQEFILTSEEDSCSIETDSNVGEEDEEEEVSEDGMMHDTKAKNLVLAGAIRSTLKDLMKANRAKRRHQTADFTNMNRIPTQVIQEQNHLLRETFESNQVIVFNTDCFEPWDNVQRLNFLECNLKEVAQ